MTRTTTGLCVAAALGFAVTLGAQQPPSPTPAPTDPPARQAPASPTRSGAHEVTVTGCVARSADGSFILDKARIGEGASSPTSATGTTGTAPAGSATASSKEPEMTWKLENGKDLEQHVGHEVQVTGHTDFNISSSGAASPTPGGSTSAAKDEPKLDVASLKMVSTSCSR